MHPQPIPPSYRGSPWPAPLREALHSQSHHQLRALQVQHPPSKRMADHVRSGQNVSTLLQPLELRNSKC